MKTITFHDVAKAAHVSPAPVSYVLNHTDRVGGGTRRDARAAVRQLGYLTNFNARNLVKNTSQTLGMIVSDIENPFFPEVIKGFGKSAREKGHDVILSDTNYDSGLMAGAAERMLQQRGKRIAGRKQR